MRPRELVPTLKRGLGRRCAEAHPTGDCPSGQRYAEPTLQGGTNWAAAPLSPFGFTLVELMVALAIAGLVVLTAQRLFAAAGAAGWRRPFCRSTWAATAPGRSREGGITSSSRRGSSHRTAGSSGDAFRSVRPAHTSWPRRFPVSRLRWLTAARLLTWTICSSPVQSRAGCGSG